MTTGKPDAPAPLTLSPALVEALALVTVRTRKLWRSCGRPSASTARSTSAWWSGKANALLYRTGGWPWICEVEGIGALTVAFWGFVGGASLLIGALIGIHAGASRRVIAIVMALGAGVLVSSVAFELMDEAYRAGCFDAASLGLLLGALIFFIADRVVSQRGGSYRKRSGDKQQDGSAVAIAIGALMDGIPESVAIGISFIGSGKISTALVAVVFLSNVPEGLSAAAGMKQAGCSTTTSSDSGAGSR
jgi:hypothetical protein